MSNSAIAAQWSLDATSATTFSMVKGLMIAASSDNVQVHAIYACMQFGNTLAMSEDTVRKVLHSLVPSPDPAPIAFLKATVGYYRNDCATQLGANTAGARFLGLAAALVPSLGALDSAKALYIMLKSSTNDLMNMPHVSHLTDLLKSLEPRSYRCGFSESVLGWQILLRKEVLSTIFPDRTVQQLDEPSLKLQKSLLDWTPSPEAVAGLVDVFRQMARVGSSTVLGVTITTSAAAPWILAFAQWCIEQPSLYVENQGRVLGEAGSRIKVIISSEPADVGKPFEATIHHQLKDLTQLLGSPSQSLVSGMVSVKSYGEWLLEELGFNSDRLLRLLHEALMHAIPKTLVNMECGEFSRLGQRPQPQQWYRPGDDPVDSGRLSPLPDIASIGKVYAEYFGLAIPAQFAPVEEDQLIADLPRVSRHLSLLEEHCPCEKCRGPLPGSQFRPGDAWCSKGFFFQKLAFIIMDIFAISLFESPSPLQIRLSRDRECTQMQTEIADFIMTGEEGAEYDDADLVTWAKEMLGHVFDEEDRSLIMTYAKGQVIYPLIFDTYHVAKYGFLKLVALPGTLKYQGDIYNVVSMPDSENSHLSQDTGWDLPAFPSVSGPMNFFKDCEFSWDISVQDDRELHARFLLRSRAKKSSIVEQDPILLLRALRDTLLLQSCPHDSRAQLQHVDRYASYSPPWHGHTEAVESIPHRVDVVAVDGADELRCFAIACSEAPVVLRRNACLACCLDFCRDADAHILIL